MKKLATYLIMILSCSYANAQQAFTNNGNLQIYAGASLAGFGNFTNSSSGLLVNNGNLYVAGNISNDQSSMAVGIGVLYFNGTSLQALNGSQSFKTYNLTTNNTTGITLNNNLSVSNTHTFLNGIITSSVTPNYLIYEAGSTYTGDGDSKHVNGWVKKSGTTNFIFPVGNATKERAIALNSLSANSVFNVKYSGATPNTMQLQSPLQNVDPYEYWTVNKASGGSAIVGMNWDNGKVAFPNWLASSIRVAAYNGSNWTDAGGTASGNATTTGTISSNTVSTFDSITFGSPIFPVPLTLVNFAAKRISNYTQLTWTTVNEYNVDHFVVERSDDGSRFYFLSQLPARNSGNVEVYYSKDLNPINHIAYYRLKSIDIDAHFNYSKIISVRDDNNAGLVLLTNPVNDRLILSVRGQLKEEFNYHINSIEGQVLQSGPFNTDHGGQQEIILKTMPPGTYLLYVTSDSQRFIFKFIKK